MPQPPRAFADYYTYFLILIISLASVRACCRSADYTKGIFQSIGFKEFHNYLILPQEEREKETVSYIAARKM